MYILFPSEFVNIKHRTLCAHTDIALNGLLHTAQTCAKATSHHILQRYLTGHTVLLGKACNGLHHRRRTTDRNAVETLFEQDGVLGDKTFFAHCAVLSGYIHITNALEILKLK